MAPLVAGAAVALGLALQVSYGTQDPLALGIVVVGVVAALAAAWVGRREEPAPLGWSVRAVLGLGLGASILRGFLFLPGVLIDPARMGPFRPESALMAVLLASWAWRGAPAWLVRARFPAIVVLFSVVAVLVIRATPAPGIDVWHYQQVGAAALADGRNPYQQRYPNRYGPGTPFIHPSLLTPDGEQVLTNPYPPLVLLADLPGALLGDVRWSLLALMLLAAFLVRALGRGSADAELAALFLLLQPQALLVVEVAWSDPLSLACLLLVLLAVQRAPGTTAADRLAWLLPGLAAGVTVASKQYTPILLLPVLLALAPALRARAVLTAAGVTAAVMLPFLAWDPPAFVLGVIQFQLRQPFRHDALSIPAFITSLDGPVLPAWPAFLLCAGVLVMTLRRRVTLQQALLSGAAAWLVFVVFNKQAFLNYYWMAVGVLCAALAVLARRA
ncbi:MAG: hypothetical protein HY904_05280 [Deltaproteobacteria bacterium]|nr:hypothetical protein [Deltaproteobacteria bacterium]